MRDSVVKPLDYRFVFCAKTRKFWRKNFSKRRSLRLFTLFTSANVSVYSPRLKLLQNHLQSYSHVLSLRLNEIFTSFSLSVFYLRFALTFSPFCRKVFSGSLIERMSAGLDALTMGPASSEVCFSALEFSPKGWITDVGRAGNQLAKRSNIPG